MTTRMLLVSVLVAAGIQHAASQARGCTSANSSNERLYLVDGSGGILATYDPETLERLSLQVTGNINGVNSLTHGYGRLFTIERNHGALMDQLVAYHPATAKAMTIGPTGISESNAPVIKYDPARDEFFVLYQEFTTPAGLWYPTLYRIDSGTGEMTYISRVHIGPPPHRFGPLAMAIGPDGQAFLSSLGTGPLVAGLNLETGQITPIGKVPIGAGRFRDMSFDSSGRMWVIYDDGVDNTKDGLYTVDPVALTFEPKLLTKDYPLSGMNAIAVAPLPSMSAYCEPSGDTTCAPSIDWEGLPSATADSGFPLHVRGTPSTSTGMILFGDGLQAPPFRGSTLCFAPPYVATAPAPSVPAGTGSPCDGSWSIDLNPEILAAGFAPGETLRAQWIGLDPSAPAGEGRVTSNALEFELAP